MKVWPLPKISPAFFVSVLCKSIPRIQHGYFLCNLKAEIILPCQGEPAPTEHSERRGNTSVGGAPALAAGAEGWERNLPCPLATGLEITCKIVILGQQVGINYSSPLLSGGLVRLV